ncbi:hypothetical protein Tco_0958703 [Tanacetum coccineum]
MVVLWNMSIRKSVGISLFESLFDVFIGFGVSPVTNDPMIVKLMRVDYECPWENKVIRRLPWQARVFTLSSGTWKSLSKNLPSGTIKITQYQVVIDRFIYWFAYDDCSRNSEGQRQNGELIFRVENDDGYRAGLVSYEPSSELTFLKLLIDDKHMTLGAW